MTDVASISATVGRLQELLLDEARPLGQLEPAVESTVLPRLRESEEMLMGLPAGIQKDLEFGRRTRSLLSCIEDKVESYALQLGLRSKTGSGRGGCMESLFKSCCIGRVVADLEVAVDRLKDCVTSYCTEQNQNQELQELHDGIAKSGEKPKWLVSRANFSSGRWGDDTVGLEEAVSKLTEVLVSEETDRRVVCIVGMGGSGKTTLAKKLFDHRVVRRHFEGVAWVFVGSTSYWSIRHIMVSILDQLSSLPRKEQQLMIYIGVPELAIQVFTILQRKRCLVVLDDCRMTRNLWRNLWPYLRIAFPFAEGCASASKIIITSQDEELYDYFGPRVGCIWRMRLLDLVHSRELFLHIWRNLAPEEGPIPEQLEQILRNILDECRGLPLAIIVLATMLRTEREDGWHNVLQWLPRNRRMDGFPIGFQYLLSAYYALPLPLKACFLYLGNFPNNSRIQVEKLCQLWIAEGLISAEDRASEETMMDVAAKYFSELVARRLVTLQEDEVSDLRLMPGHIHDLTRELCILVGEVEEFFQIVESMKTFDYQPQMRSKAQRCAIYFNEYYVPDVLENPKLHLDQQRMRSKSQRFAIYFKRHYYVSGVSRSDNLRSLLCLNSEQPGQGSRWPQGLFNFKELRSLRVLDFELVYLRYLSFRGCHLKDLPSYIGNFLYLQTLDLRVQKHCIMTISNVIWKLERLRHLYFPLAFQTPDHHGTLILDSLKQLEILEGLDTSVCRAKDLIKLTNLRILAATAEGNLEDLKHIIDCIDINSSHLSRTSLDIKKFDCYSQERLSFIKRLFSCPVLDTLQAEGRIGKMSDIGTISGRFTKIVLKGSELDQDPMPTLGNLCNLRILVLEVEAYIGEDMCCSGTSFPELRYLKLSKLYNLKAWKVANGALQKLSTLEVSMCSRMKMLPEGLKTIITLRKLKISMMPQQFLGRLQKQNDKGGEDLYKINSKCSIKFGNDDPWLESTNSACQGDGELQDNNEDTNFIANRGSGQCSDDSVQVASSSFKEEDELLHQCMEILNSIEDLDDASYAKAFKLFSDDAAKAKMFVKVSKSRRRELIRNL